MTVKVKDFIDNTKLPKFLSNSKVLLSFDKVGKVFPSIGLPNCRESVILDNAPFVNASATNFISVFAYLLEDPINVLRGYPVAVRDGGKNVSDDKLNKVSYWYSVTKKLYDMLYYRLKDCIVNENDKVLLRMPDNISDDSGKVVYKKGESIFRVYNKIFNSLKELRCGASIEKLDTMPEFKRFSSDNLPNNRFEIVFSSDGVGGLWDIATMSMRGITSCQSWDGQYKNNLVGSIVDPFVGIIYLTSDSKYNDLGSKMVKRSIVRLAMNSQTDKPYLIVDRMYPEYDQEIEKKFVKFLKDRVGDKLDVHFAPNMDYELYKKSYIPTSKVHSKLTNMTMSYRDSKIPYKKDLPVTDVTLFSKNCSAKRLNFRNSLRNISYNIISNSDNYIEISDDKLNSSLSIMYGSPDFKFLVREYYTAVANKIIDECPMDDILSSKEYLRRLCFSYLRDKDRLLRGQRIAFVKKLNKYFGFPKENKVNIKVLSKVFEPIEKAIVKELKQKLLQLLNKKTGTLNLPN